MNNRDRDRLLVPLGLWNLGSCLRHDGGCIKTLKEEMPTKRKRSTCQCQKSFAYCILHMREHEGETPSDRELDACIWFVDSSRFSFSFCCSRMPQSIFCIFFSRTYCIPLGHRCTLLGDVEDVKSLDGEHRGVLLDL